MVAAPGLHTVVDGRGSAACPYHTHELTCKRCSSFSSLTHRTGATQAPWKQDEVGARHAQSEAQAPVGAPMGHGVCRMEAEWLRAAGTGCSCSTPRSRLPLNHTQLNARHSSRLH